MRAISKPFLTIALILLVLFASILLFLNLYLRSRGVQERLLGQLSSLVGTPVSIKGVMLMPFGGIRLSGVSAGIQGKPPFLSADSIAIGLDYSQLIHGRIALGSIVVRHPAVCLSPTQTFPQPQGSAFSSGPSPFDQSSSHHIAQKNEKSSAKEAPPHIKHLSIIGGEFSFLNDLGRQVFFLSGIELKGVPDERSRSWTGHIAIKEMIIGNRLKIHDVHSPAKASENMTSLSLYPLTATLGGGKLSGNATFELNHSTPDYSATINLSNASLKELMADSSLEHADAEGTLSGTLDVSGTAGNGSTIGGKGSLLCTDATIQPAGFLKQIGQLLQIDELQLLRLAEGKCLFHLVSGHVVIDDLFLRSENLILTAQGPLMPTGELDLQSRLLFNEKLTRRLRGFLGPQLTPAPEAGYSQISFHISGTTLNPRTDLLERITGLKIGGNLGGFLQGIFGRPAPPPTASPAH